MEAKEICSKIVEMYPDIGECGIQVDVAYDEPNNRWAVDLRKDTQHLKTYLEEGDAESCMLGKQCVGLGIEIAQLRSNIERLREA